VTCDVRREGSMGCCGRSCPPQASRRPLFAACRQDQSTSQQWHHQHRHRHRHRHHHHHHYHDSVFSRSIFSSMIPTTLLPATVINAATIIIISIATSLLYPHHVSSDNHPDTFCHLLCHRHLLPTSSPGHLLSRHHLRLSSPSISSPLGSLLHRTTHI
jgi:hypothetical protein